MMEGSFTALFEQFGYAAILLLIFAETVFPPIPSEAILLFGGFMLARNGMSIWLGVLFATVGSLLGAWLLYQCGRLLSEDTIRRFCSGKVGKLLRLKVSDVDKADKWFQRHGYWAVLICRCVPIVRSLISIPAGVAKMKQVPFLLLTAVGSTVWNTLLVWLGAKAGDSWEELLYYFDMYGEIIGGVCLCLAIIGIVVYITKRPKQD